MTLRLIGTDLTGFRPTDHTPQILILLGLSRAPGCDPLRSLSLRTAAALLSCHDSTSLSLDDWKDPRAMVEHLLGHPILPNQI